MAGHVFITHSNLARLNCDAWLLPCDEHFVINPAWSLSGSVRGYIRRLQSGEIGAPPDWSRNGVRVFSLPGSGEEGVPYLVNMGGWRGTEIDWYMEGVRQFVEAAISGLHARNAHSGRVKPLLGMPLVGTGWGGAREEKGAVVRTLIEVLHEEVELRDLDIVLVVRDEPAFMAAQNARRDFVGNCDGTMLRRAWADLSPSLVDEAVRLASHAARRRLVLFVGAGVSQGAALPSWKLLLEGLAEDARMSYQEQSALGRLHALDRALIIQHRLEAQGTTIGKAVSKRIGSPRFSLSHSLLASLPVSEVVTTNYDCLFEEASSAAGRDVAVLPYEAAIDRTRWLLKLHGSITNPDDIVLTREHYLRYSDRRAALSAIVQALLITRHMLFVGFSLTDDNFHRIVDDVRKVLAQPDDEGTSRTGAQFGSALLLKYDGLLEELWREDLRLVNMGGEPRDDSGSEARILEVFLDLLVSESARGNSPLLDPAYEGVLSDEEREIRGLLQRLEADASAVVRSSAAWAPINELLTRLGRPSRHN